MSSCCRTCQLILGILRMLSVGLVQDAYDQCQAVAGSIDSRKFMTWSFGSFWFTCQPHVSPQYSILSEDLFIYTFLCHFFQGRTRLPLCGSLWCCHPAIFLCVFQCYDEVALALPIYPRVVQVLFHRSSSKLRNSRVMSWHWWSYEAEHHESWLTWKSEIEQLWCLRDSGKPSWLSFVDLSWDMTWPFWSDYCHALVLYFQRARRAGLMIWRDTSTRDAVLVDMHFAVLVVWNSPLGPPSKWEKQKQLGSAEPIWKSQPLTAKSSINSLIIV